MNENQISSNVNQTGNHEQGYGKPVKSKKPLIIACACIAVGLAAALAVTVAVAAYVMASPAALLVQGAKNSAQALEENPVIELLTDVADGGSVELKLGFGQIIEMLLGYGDMGIDGDISIKFYSDLDEEKSAAVAKVETGGEVLADASILLSGKEVVVTSEKLLDGGMYGIDLEHAAENFQTSVFGPDGYLYLGIDSIDGVTEYVERGDALKEEYEELSEDIAKVLLRSLKEHAEFSKDGGEVMLAEESVRADIVQVVLDREGAVAVLTDLIAYLRECDNVDAFLETYAEIAEQNMRAEYDADPVYYEENYGISSFEEYRAYFYGDDYKEAFYAELDELEAELETFDEFDKLTALFYITKLRKELVGADLNIEAEGEISAIELRAGPSMKDLREISLHVTTAYDNVTILYEVEANDKTEYVAEFSVLDDDFEVFTCEVEWDRQDGDFEVALVENGGRYFVESTLEVSGEGAVLRLETIGLNSVMLDLDAVVTLKTDDKMPAMPQDYVDIMKLTNDDLEMLAADVAAQLINKIYTLDSSLAWVLGMLLGV